MREKLIEVKRTLGMCVKQGIASECKGCPYSKSKRSCVDALMEDALTVINHLERKESVQRWIPVTERLPKREDANLYESVLAINKEDGVPRSWLWDVVADYHEKFTRWMPMPEAPKGE